MRLKILLLEDDSALLDMLKLLAHKSEYEVYSFTSIDQAKQALNDQFIDIVLSDFFLGKETAIDLFNYLRFDLQKNLPFILMTGHALTNEMNKILENKNTLLLKKPFLKADLEEAIQKTKK